MTWRGPRFIAVAGGLLLLTVRGLLLWLVVPIGVLVWALARWRLTGDRGTLGGFLGWLDLNLIAALGRSLFRPAVASAPPSVPLREMPGTKHGSVLATPSDTCQPRRLRRACACGMQDCGGRIPLVAHVTAVAG